MLRSKGIQSYTNSVYRCLHRVIQVNGSLLVDVDDCRCGSVVELRLDFEFQALLVFKEVVGEVVRVI